jgi:hypothetical protein
MAVLPAGRAQRLQWFKDHIALWKLNAAGIGVTPAAMTAFEVLITSADANFQAMNIARDGAKSATQKFYNAADDMISPGRDYIAVIKAFAESTNNPNVLVLANIPPDAPATPAQPPSTPANLVGSISTTGVLTLNWEAASHGASTGIVFLVSKRLGGSGSFSIVGATFDRSFIDATFNPGAGLATYQVQAQRGNLFSSFSNSLSVDLGLGGFTFTSGVAGNIGGEEASGGTIAQAA